MKLAVLSSILFTFLTRQYYCRITKVPCRAVPCQNRPCFTVPCRAVSTRPNTTPDPDNGDSRDKDMTQTDMRPKRRRRPPDHLQYYATEDKRETCKKNDPEENAYRHDQQYADDLGYAANRRDIIDKIKTDIPQKLTKYNLTVNIQKTEQHTVHRNGPDSWQDCKYLGSLLDTEKDMTKRQNLANLAFNKYRHILTSQKLRRKTGPQT